MNYQLESRIIKTLAIVALAAALLAVGKITLDTGIIGGSGSTAESADITDSAAAVASDEAAPAEAAPATATRTHVVADGDSFYSIARKYNTTINEIQKLNPNIDPQHLTAGIRLAIP